MWHKIANWNLNYSFANGKLKWHKNPEKKHHKKKLGNTSREHKNKTSPQSKLICVLVWKEEGRGIVISKWWVECLKIHKELTQLGCLLRALICGKRGWAQPETLSVKMRLSRAWAGETRKTGREKPACGAFLLRGEI